MSARLLAARWACALAARLLEAWGDLLYDLSHLHPPLALRAADSYARAAEWIHLAQEIGRQRARLCR